jgi:hypothetical protein
MSLFDSIEALAVKLAYEVLAAIGASTLNEVLAVGSNTTAAPSPRSRAPGRSPASAGRRAVRARPARGASDAAATKAIEVLRRSPYGLRTETLRTLVGAPKPSYQQMMLKLVAAGRVAKSGSKRATTYRVA